eukprot:11226581-Lingulodinium_polyedra.AAC.1
MAIAAVLRRRSLQGTPAQASSSSSVAETSGETHLTALNKFDQVLQAVIPAVGKKHNPLLGIRALALTTGMDDRRVSEALVALAGAGSALEEDALGTVFNYVAARARQGSLLPLAFFVEEVRRDSSAAPGHLAGRLVHGHRELSQALARREVHRNACCCCAYRRGLHGQHDAVPLQPIIPGRGCKQHDTGDHQEPRRTSNITSLRPATALSPGGYAHHN